jgi:hypothetical protein
MGQGLLLPSLNDAPCYHLLSNPCLEAGSYGQASLSSISPSDSSQEPTILCQNRLVFRGSSADYGPESTSVPEWNSFGDSQVGGMISLIISRNLQPSGYEPVNS